MKSRQDKRINEVKVLKQMVHLYCKHSHKTKELCPECEEIVIHSTMRINKCPFMEKKTFCSQCRIHCYKEQQRDKIRDVMKYAGPRMIFKKPMLVIRHIKKSMKMRRR